MVHLGSVIVVILTTHHQRGCALSDPLCCDSAIRVREAQPVAYVVNPSGKLCMRSSCVVSVKQTLTDCSVVIEFVKCHERGLLTTYE